MIREFLPELIFYMETAKVGNLLFENNEHFAWVYM